MIVFQSNVIKVNKKALTSYIGVVSIFDLGLGGGKLNHKSHIMTSSKFFEKKKFLRDKDIAECRIKSRGLGWHVTWVLLRKKDLNQKLKRFPKLSELGDVVSKLVSPNVSQTGVWGPPLGNFLEFFFRKKMAILMPFGSHFARF